MDWIYCKDQMPPEKSIHIDGRNYLDKKDRDYTESDQVFVAYSNGTYGIFFTRNGKFRILHDCDNFPYEVVAWMSIPELKLF